MENLPIHLPDESCLMVRLDFALTKGWDYAILFALIQIESTKVFNEEVESGESCELGYAHLSVDFITKRTGFNYAKQLKVIKALEADRFIKTKKVGIPPVRMITVYK